MILRDATTRFNVEIFDYLDHEEDIPTITTSCRQGDVSVLRVTTTPATTPVPAAGTAVIRGENGGNTHSLHGDGILFDQATPSVTSLLLGTLTVPDGTSAFLLHPEHGGFQIMPGTYRIGRQREMADEIRMVAD